MANLSTPGRLVLLVLLNLPSHANMLPVRATGPVAVTHNRAKEVNTESDVGLQQRHAPVRHAKARAARVLLEGVEIDNVAKGTAQQVAKHHVQQVAKDKAHQQEPLTMLIAGCSVLFVLVLVLLLLLVLFVRLSLGNMVKTQIETVDQDMIGTDVEVGSFQIKLLFGQVLLRDVKVLNPAKSGYLLPNLLTIESVDIDLCVPTLLRTLGGSLVINSLVIKNVHVNVEKHSIWSSNVKEISDFLNADDGDAADPKGDDEEKAVAAESENADAANAPAWLVLHTLKLEQMSVTLQNEMFHKALDSHQLKLADIVYSDFEKESGGKKGTAKITAFLLQTVLKNVRSTFGM